jgi:hypothetical protein
MTGFAVMVALGAAVAPPAASGTPFGPVLHRVPAPGTGATPALCRPDPPDYPGCRPAQVRPLLRIRFAREYTGHAAGYRYHRMGQHRRGVIFDHLTPALNRKLGRLYRTAVRRAQRRHAAADGVRRGVAHHGPRYRTWGGFKANATSFCNGTNITVHFPTQYCWSITKLGQAGHAINRLLDRTTRILFSCNGYAIGGLATGTYAAWKMGTGLLSGGYYGAVGVEIGCQTTNLWNWATHLW